MDLETLYTPAEVAKYFGVSPQTVRIWIKSGKLRAIKLGTKGSALLRVPESALSEMIG